VQDAAMKALRGEGGFRPNLEANPAVSERLGNLGTLFDPTRYLKDIDVVFDRLSLSESAVRR
jgi:hypothetical protein